MVNPPMVTVQPAIVAAKATTPAPVVSQVDCKPSPNELSSTKTVEVPMQPRKLVVEPLAKPKAKPQPIVINKKLGDLSVFGEIEYASIIPEGLRQKARIDTGAQTSSVGVTKYSMFERDGKNWVLFNIHDANSNEDYEFKRRLKRRVRIKRHDAESERRPVVKLEIQVGKLKQLIEVTLSERDKFDYPILIGRNFLEGEALVDVSRKYLTLDSK